MQRQIKDICAGEGCLWGSREKQLIHRSCTEHPNGRFGSRGSGVRCYDQADRRTRGSECDVRTIEESTADATFGMCALVIWRQVEAGSNGRQIEQAILFATYDDPHPGREGDGEHSSSAVQAIKTDQDT